MKNSFFSAAALALGLSFSQSAFANVHFMEIVEIYPGSANATNAQYVVLQMHAGGQNITSETAVHVFDANNVLIEKFVFANDVANGGNQAKILIATQAAVDLFKQNAAFDADLIMNAVIPLAGGKVCFIDEDNNFNFGTIDCASWGNFANANDPDAGAPFNAAGLELGRAMLRNLAITGGATTLEGGDDTDDSATDFLFGDPKPVNNAGIAGASTTCGNGTIEGVENCDGAQLNGEDCTTQVNDPDPAGLACNADCLGFNVGGCGNALVCGNGLVEAGEQCEPPDAANCDADCQLINIDGGCGCNVASNSSPLSTAVFVLLFAAPLLILRRRNTKK